ncbi:MAG: ribosome maturation factor RimP [Candidatus Omnitrophica bacterium]|jgi:ribosome maturation factor RimP|nr:ribosome maturation factor RimP [Candidatus Omnitrophota bacterium]
MGLIKEALIKELEELFSGCADKENLELVDLICKYEGNKLILRVLADKPQGAITLGECALLNRRLGDLLAEKNIIDDDYVLEVSSPGLDRYLVKPKDFLRSINKQASFYLSELINGKCEWHGEINKVEAESVFINSCGKILEIPLTKINKAKLVI